MNLSIGRHDRPILRIVALPKPHLALRHMAMDVSNDRLAANRHTALRLECSLMTSKLPSCASALGREGLADSAVLDPLTPRQPILVRPADVFCGSVVQPQPGAVELCGSVSQADWPS